MPQIVIDQNLIEGYQSALETALQQQSELTRKLEVMTQAADNGKMMSIDQARDYLGGISEDSLLHYRKHGLDYYKKGRTGVWYRKGDIDNWLATGKVRQAKQR